MVALFSDHPDAFIEFVGGRYKKKEGIERLFIGRFAKNFVHGRNGPVHGFLLDHAMMQDIVDVNDDGTMGWARFRTFMSAGVHKSVADSHPRGFDPQGRVRQWWEGGLYENQYIKENGVWKFFKMRYFAFWHSDYVAGWAETSPNYVPFPTATYPEDPQGPDELVEQQMMWPDTRVVPFHYPHPVTGKGVAENDLRAPLCDGDPSKSKPSLSINS